MEHKVEAIIIWRHNYGGVYRDRGLTPIMENQAEKNMKNELEQACYGVL